MKGALLLSIVAFCGLLAPSYGTSCEANTLSTCTTSLFVTGTCASSKCACTTGKVAGPYGCQVQQQATLTATSPPHFNGQGKTGGELVLTCSGDAPYTFYKDGTAHTTGVSGAVLTLASLALTTFDGAYTCKSMISGVESTVSDAVTLAVLNSPATKAVITGMPTKIIDGQTISLTCTNVQALATGAPQGVYQWKINAAVQTPVIQTGAIPFAAADVGKSVTCIRDSVISTAVTFPASAETDITGAEIWIGGAAATTKSLIKGETVILTCYLTDGFSNAVTVGDAVYAWQKDGNALSGTAKTYSLATTATTDTGVYACTAKQGSNPIKTSSSVTITVTENMEKSIVYTGSTAFPTGPSAYLQTGYYSFLCKYRTINTATPVTYKWYKGGNEMLGVTDSMIQINNVGGTTLDAAYTCSVTSADGTVTNTAKTINAVAFQTADTPTLTSGVSGDYGIGTAETFTCRSTYYTPGMTFEWTVASTVQTTTTSTFSYTPTATSVAITCKYKFLGGTSAASNVINVLGKYLRSIAIWTQGRSFTPTPVTGSTLQMTCVTTTSASAGAVTYQWKKATADTVTTMAYENAFSATTAVDCTATSSGESRAASQITVTPQAAAATPSIVLASGDVTMRRGGAYNMMCSSASEAVGATYEWKKGGTVVAGATGSVLTLSPLTTDSDGIYTCTITVNSITSSASTGKTVTTVADEQSCSFADQCELTNFDHTVCASGKCICTSGNTYSVGTCSDATTIIGSLVLMISSVIALRFF